MRAPWLDFSESAATNNAVFHAFLFVEGLNNVAAERARTGPLEPSAMQRIVLEVRRQLTRPQASWPKTVPFIRLLDLPGLLRPPQSELIDRIALLLLQPATVSHETVAGHWALTGTSNLPSIPTPSRLDVTGWLFDTPFGTQFSTAPLPLEPSTRFREVPFLFLDQALDPLSVAQKLLLDASRKSTNGGADFYIQRAIKSLFGGRYSDATKAALSRVCFRLNDLFFGQAAPSTHDTHRLRPATVSLGLLLAVISSALDDLKEEQAVGALSPPVAFSQPTIGVFLGLLFSRVFRTRFSWISTSPHPSNLESDKFRLLRPAVDGNLSVTALKPIEYMYLHKRLFGSISEIDGLNFIFGGGIIPRTKSGRTMAILGPPGSGKTVLVLQKLVNVAAHGGLAVYFSFEETYELIENRLVSFNLQDPSRFAFYRVGADISAVIAAHFGQRTGKGLLLFFGLPGQEEFLVTNYIEQIAIACRDGARWKAVAIDSINALEFRAPPDASVQLPSRQTERGLLRDLVETIENNRLLGLIIAEADDDYRALPYLADTVISLGFDELRLGRWIEISKCRNQDFHRGQHPCRIVAGHGLKIYPSLSAIRTTLRRKIKSTLSEEKAIPIPGAYYQWETRGLAALREKSSTLIYGPDGTGKSLLAIRLAMQPALGLIRNSSSRSSEHASTPSVLVVTFRTSEARYLQTLRLVKDKDIERCFLSIGRYHIHAYSPGMNITADQVVGRINRYIEASRREGIPIERVVFDEIESAELLLPRLRSQPLFWPTILELMGAEALTSFFVFGGDTSDAEAIRVIRPEVDYVLNLHRTNEGRVLRAVKMPDVDGATE